MTDSVLGEDLDWDSILGAVDAEEQEEKSKPDKFEALPDGPYEVVVQEADKTVSKAGNDMIKARVQVTSGPSANRVLFSHIVFSPGNKTAMRMTLERLAAFGITREFIGTTQPSVAQIAESLVGRRAIAVVGTQKEGEYAGRNEIKSFRALEGVDQTAPQVAASKPGIPSIPTPNVEVAPPVTVPTPPVPQVPVADGTPADDPFKG